MGDDFTITGDEWASSIEDSGSDADTVSFGDQDISINDDDSSSTSSDDSDDFGGVSDTSDSDDSGAYDRYGTGAYDGDVGSGTVGAVSSDADEDLQSEQVTDVEDEMEGDLDRYTASTTVNEDGSTSFIAESNLGETVEAVTENTPFADEGMIDPVGGSDITWRQLLIGAGAAGTVAAGVYYSG